MMAVWSGFLTLAGALLGVLIQRVFKITDDLRKEDSLLHERINDLAAVTVHQPAFDNFSKQVLDEMREIRNDIKAILKAK